MTKGKCRSLKILIFVLIDFSIKKDIIKLQCYLWFILNNLVNAVRNMSFFSKRIFILTMFSALIFFGLTAFSFSKENSYAYNISIKKQEFKLYLFQGTNIVKIYPIATGKNPGDKVRGGDFRTPLGKFYIKQIQDSSSWEHDFHDGKGSIKGAYGPWFLRLYTGSDRTKSGKGWKGIGIHGTHDPSSIGTMASEGCIRMNNEDVSELKSLVRIGTSVTIDP
jgi:hypothetical protein